MAGLLDPINPKLIAAEVRANNELLNGCKRHKFEGSIPLDMVERYRFRAVCVNCGGWMRLTDVNQYIRGFEAAGRSGNEIWQGWR